MSDDNELSYEDFDDVAWIDGDDLEVIDLDTLEDPIPEPPAPEPDAEAAKIEESPAPEPVVEEPEPEPEPVAEAAKIEEAELPTPEPVAEAAPVEPEPEPPAPEPVAQAVKVEEAEPAAEAAEIAESEEPPAPEPPPLITYRVLIPLPPELGAQVLSLREIGEIVGMPPPGIEMAVPFQSRRREDIEAVLNDWTRSHLPLQIEITGVLARVIGAQQYVAGWTLDPEEELSEAQLDLIRTLAPMIVLPPNASASAHVRMIIGDAIPPQRYPHVVGQMQRTLKPYVWHAQTVVLYQAAAGDWEAVKTFD